MRCLLALTLISLTGCPFGGGGPPAPDSCNNGSSDGVTTLQIGLHVDPFVPYRDGQEPDTAQGGQGAIMLPIRLRVTGPNPPACLSQSSVVESAMCFNTPSCHFVNSASDSVPLATYALDDGSRVTKPHYIVLENFGSEGGYVTTTVGAVTTTVVFRGPRPSDMSGVVPSDLGPPRD